MFQKLKIAALSAILGLGAVAAVPAAAQADSFYFGIGSNGPSFGYRSVRHRHWRACTPRHALHKARRMGLNHAHIRRANRNRIRINGRHRGHRAHVVFSRAPHCPVIHYRL